MRTLRPSLRQRSSELSKQGFEIEHQGREARRAFTPHYPVRVRWEGASGDGITGDRPEAIRSGRKPDPGSAGRGSPQCWPPRARVRGVGVRGAAIDPSQLSLTRGRTCLGCLPGGGPTFSKACRPPPAHTGRDSRWMRVGVNSGWRIGAGYLRRWVLGARQGRHDLWPSRQAQRLVQLQAQTPAGVAAHVLQSQAGSAGALRAGLEEQGRASCAVGLP